MCEHLPASPAAPPGISGPAGPAKDSGCRGIRCPPGQFPVDLPAAREYRRVRRSGEFLNFGALEAVPVRQGARHPAAGARLLPGLRPAADRPAPGRRDGPGRFVGSGTRPTPTQARPEAMMTRRLLTELRAALGDQPWWVGAVVLLSDVTDRPAATAGAWLTIAAWLTLRVVRRSRRAADPPRERSGGRDPPGPGEADRSRIRGRVQARRRTPR